jgi:hypothetical protein
LSKKDDEVKAELNKAKADLQKETDTKVGNCRRDLEKIIADNIINFVNIDFQPPKLGFVHTILCNLSVQYM